MKGISASCFFSRRVLKVASMSRMVRAAMIRVGRGKAKGKRRKGVLRGHGAAGEAGMVGGFDVLLRAALEVEAVEADVLLRAEVAAVGAAVVEGDALAAVGGLEAFGE